MSGHEHTCHGGMNPPFPGPCAACETEQEAPAVTQHKTELTPSERQELDRLLALVVLPETFTAREREVAITVVRPLLDALAAGKTQEGEFDWQKAWAQKHNQWAATMTRAVKAEAETASLREQFAAHAIQCPQCQDAALQAAAGTNVQELIENLRKQAHDQGAHLSKDVEALIACALALRRQVSALQGELAKMQESRDYWKGMVEERTAAVSKALQAASDAIEQRDAARDALRRYGGHTRDCKINRHPLLRCTCGWHDVAALGQPAEP